MNMISKFSSGLAAVAGFALGAAPQAAMACAMCGLPPGDHSSHAYNSSVLFMMIAPYAIVGGTALGLYVAYRHARARHRAEHDGDESLAPRAVSRQIMPNERI